MTPSMGHTKILPSPKLSVPFMYAHDGRDDLTDEFVGHEPGQQPFWQVLHDSGIFLAVWAEIAQAALASTPQHSQVNHLFSANFGRSVQSRMPLLRADNCYDFFHSVTTLFTEI